MIKANKVLALATTLFLIGCGNTQDPMDPELKEIDDETAIARAEEILTHQNDPNFQWPSRVKINQEGESFSDIKGPKSERKTLATNTAEVTYLLDDLVYEYKKSLTSERDGTTTTQSAHNYSFWKNGIYYSLIDETKNGKQEKYRTETSLTRSEAEAKFKDDSDKKLRNYVKAQANLEDFAQFIKEDKEDEEHAKLYPGSSFFRRYGSNDNRSFERRREAYFIEHNVEEGGYTFETLMNSNTYRVLFLNDICHFLGETQTEELTGNDEGYYNKSKDSTINQMSYNEDVKDIELPNIEDYPLKGE